MPQKFGAKDDFGSYRQYQKDKQLLLQRKYYKRNLGEKISLAYEQVNMEVHIRHQVEQAGQFMSHASVAYLNLHFFSIKIKAILVDTFMNELLCQCLLVLMSEAKKNTIFN